LSFGLYGLEAAFPSWPQLVPVRLGCCCRSCIFVCQQRGELALAPSEGFGGSSVAGAAGQGRKSCLLGRLWCFFYKAQLLTSVSCSGTALELSCLFFSSSFPVGAGEAGSGGGTGLPTVPPAAWSPSSVPRLRCGVSGCGLGVSVGSGRVAESQLPTAARVLHKWKSHCSNWRAEPRGCEASGTGRSVRRSSPMEAFSGEMGLRPGLHLGTALWPRPGQVWCSQQCLWEQPRRVRLG